MVVESELGDKEDGRMDRSATWSVWQLCLYCKNTIRGDFCKKSSKSCDSIYTIS